jgi:predicted PurR-regulated permease PerM
LGVLADGQAIDPPPSGLVCWRVVEGPSTSTVARATLLLASLSLLGYGLYLVRGVVLLVGIAAFVATALAPPVNALTRRRVPRPVAILTVYFALAAGMAGTGAVFVPSVIDGVDSIATGAPGYIAHFRRSGVYRRYDREYKISAKIRTEIAGLPQRVGDAAGTLRDVTVGVFDALGQLFIVATLSFLLLLEGPRAFARGVDRLPDRFGPEARALATDIYRTVGGYVAGNLAISLIAGLVSLITLEALQIPSAVPWAVLMALFDLLPLVGATIGAALVGVATLFHGFPETTIIWVLVQIAYQQVESSILVPVIYRRTVKVNGLVTILAVLLGSALLGLLGALIAIPIAAALQIIVIELRKFRTQPIPDKIVLPQPGTNPT